MDAYKVDDYVAYGTSAIREMKNSRIILNQIENTAVRNDVILYASKNSAPHRTISREHCGIIFCKYSIGAD